MLYQLCGGYDDKTPKHASNPQINAAFMEQQHLGFWNFTKGIISKKFEEAQDSHYNEIKAYKQKFSGQKWTRVVISMMHSLLTEVWKFRCKVLHSTQNETVEIRMKMRAQEILEYYKHNSWQLSKGDEYLVQRKNNFVRSTNRSIRNWIERIENSVREKATHVQFNEYDIRTYFQGNAF